LDVDTPGWALVWSTAENGVGRCRLAARVNSGNNNKDETLIVVHRPCTRSGDVGGATRPSAVRPRGSGRRRSAVAAHRLRGGACRSTCRGRSPIAAARGSAPAAGLLTGRGVQPPAHQPQVSHAPVARGGCQHRAGATVAMARPRGSLRHAHDRRILSTAQQAGVHASHTRIKARKSSAPGSGRPAPSRRRAPHHAASSSSEPSISTISTSTSVSSASSSSSSYPPS